MDYKCEKPKYSTVRTLGRRRDFLGRSRPAAEIRRYAPVLVAEVLVEGGGMREALGSGFRQIAGFIFGKNVAPGSSSSGASEKVAMTSPVTLEPAGAAPASAKIAMTSPVAAEMAGGGAYKVSFVMPSKYTRETLPTPLNEAVKIVEKPARTLAALTWRGAIPKNSGVVDERVRQLRGLLAEAGVEPVGAPHLWQCEFGCFLELPVEAENSQPTKQSLTDIDQNENRRPPALCAAVHARERGAARGRRGGRHARGGDLLNALLTRKRILRVCTCACPRLPRTPRNACIPQFTNLNTYG